MQQNIPLAERLRPKTLDDVISQSHLLGNGEILRMPRPRVMADFLSAAGEFV